MKDRNRGKNKGIHWFGFDGAACINPGKWRYRILVGIPMTGQLRAEWVLARYHQVIPCNWSQADAIMWLDTMAPLGFTVADARNVVATQCIEKGYEWLFFIDHDTILPQNTIIRLNQRMIENKVPMWSGLYFTKSKPAEPILYRGRGNGYYNGWKMGDEVWVDGIPMGCTMIHRSILQVLYDESPAYEVRTNQGTWMARKFFQTPAFQVYDPEARGWYNASGTEDLDFCARIIQEGVLKRAGWPKIAGKKYPFMVDTNIFCRHVDENGLQYPSAGEEKAFMPEKVKK